MPVFRSSAVCWWKLLQFPTNNCKCSGSTAAAAAVKRYFENAVEINCQNIGYLLSSSIHESMTVEHIWTIWTRQRDLKSQRTMKNTSSSFWTTLIRWGSTSLSHRYTPACSSIPHLSGMLASNCVQIDMHVHGMVGIPVHPRLHILSTSTSSLEEPSNWQTSGYVVSTHAVVEQIQRHQHSWASLMLQLELYPCISCLRSLEKLDLARLNAAVKGWPLSKVCYDLCES